MGFRVRRCSSPSRRSPRCPKRGGCRECRAGAPSRDQRLDQAGRERRASSPENSPSEVDGRAGELPMAGRRVLAARCLDAIAPLRPRGSGSPAAARAGRSLRRRPRPSASRRGSAAGRAASRRDRPVRQRRLRRYGPAYRRPHRHKLLASSAPPQPNESSTMRMRAASCAVSRRHASASIGEGGGEQSARIVVLRRAKTSALPRSPPPCRAASR